MARKVTHLVRTTLKSNKSTGAQAIQVEDLMTGKRKSYPLNYSAFNKHEDAAQRFTGAHGVTLKRETRTGRGNVYAAWVDSV